MDVQRTSGDSQRDGGLYARCMLRSGMMQNGFPMPLVRVGGPARSCAGRAGDMHIGIGGFSEAASPRSEQTRERCQRTNGDAGTLVVCLAGIEGPVEGVTRASSHSSSAGFTVMNIEISRRRTAHEGKMTPAGMALRLVQSPDRGTDICAGRGGNFPDEHRRGAVVWPEIGLIEFGSQAGIRGSLQLENYRAIEMYQCPNDFCERLPTTPTTGPERRVRTC